MSDAKIEVDEYNLEDLIVLGEDKKIPIEVTFPKPDGTPVKAKALVKQLTLKEIDMVKINNPNVLEANLLLLSQALFKANGENFTEKELLNFPMGVVSSIAEKIMEISGVNLDPKELKDF